MKFGIFSDTHLEFWNRYSQNEVNALLAKLQMVAADVDVMINAGDTHPSVRIRNEVRGLFDPGKYIEVLGNHDHYGSKWPKQEDFKQYVFGDLKVIAGTLWTNFGNSSVVEYYADRGVYDFRIIEGISTDKVKHRHQLTVEYIELMKPDIVVTHFAPHHGSIHPKYAGQALNPYFVNDLSATIEKVQPKLWVHGHVHDTFDYTVDQTRVVANPMGYPGEHRTSTADYEIKIVEI
jgi:Icc-related predicted phosphoesterase